MSSADDHETRSETNATEPSSGRAQPRSERQSSSGGLEDWVEALREMAPYLDLGWRLAGAVAGPPLLGHFLVDAWWGTTPWGLLAGCAAGIAAAALQLKALLEELDS